MMHDQELSITEKCTLEFGEYITLHIIVFIASFIAAFIVTIMISVPSLNFTGFNNSFLGFIKDLIEIAITPSLLVAMIFIFVLVVFLHEQGEEIDAEKYQQLKKWLYDYPEIFNNIDIGVSSNKKISNCTYNAIDKKVKEYIEKDIKKRIFNGF